MTYHVGPPIRSDASYYRDDLEPILAALKALDSGAWSGVLVSGVARAGKTSTLHRFSRLLQGQTETTSSGEPVRWPGPERVEFLDLRDWGARAAPGNEPADHLAQVLARETGRPVWLLLDELDSVLDADEWPPERAKRFTRVLREQVSRLRVVTASSTAVEDCAEATWLPWRDLVETYSVHTVRGLSDAEAQALVEQRRAGASPLDAAAVGRVMACGARLPMPLQVHAYAELHQTQPFAQVDYAGGLFRRLSPSQRVTLETLVTGGVPPPEPLARLAELGVTRLNDGRWGVSDPFVTAWLKALHHTTAATVEPATAWEPQVTVLHLSDLHFDPDNIRKFTGLEPGALLASLRRALEAPAVGEPFPDLVAISGDLSWSAHPEEFDLAIAFLNGLAAWLAERWGITLADAKRRFVIVPGNHDASWLLSDGLLEGTSVKPACAPWMSYATAPFAEAYAAFFDGARRFESRSPLAVLDYPEFDCLVLALSSCHGIHRHERNGCLDADLVARAMSSGLPDRGLRLAVFHHNVEPVHRADKPHYFETDFLHNGEDVLPRLDPTACLHGHTHLTRPGQRAKCGVVCFGAGSFGVNARHLPGHPSLGLAPRQFSLIAFERSKAQQRARLWTRQCVPGADGRYAWAHGSYQGHVVELRTGAPAVKP